MARLAVEGHKSIHYEYMHGADPSLPAVVLSHGWGMACRVWDDTVATLQDHGYPVLVYDQRNCGQSDKDFAAVGISDLGDDVVALVATLQLERCVLNGWSLGGAVVVDAAAKLDERVTGLVLTGGATPCYTQREGFAHGGTAADVAGTVAALRAGRVDFLKGLYFEGVFVASVSEDVKGWCWQLALQASSGADASLGALADLDQREIMAGIDCPALVIGGVEDGVVPIGIAETAAELLPNATLWRVDNCGHAPFLEHAEAYRQRLLTFLQKEVSS